MSSAPGTERLIFCASCGATIYQEHIDRGLAGRWAGDLLCPHCLSERREADAAASDPDMLMPAAGQGAAPAWGGLADTEPSGEEDTAPAARSGRGATRMKTFHAKLNDGAVQHLDRQVNAWMASQRGLEIKFANTTVGVWEGKHAEPSLIVTLFF